MGGNAISNASRINQENVAATMEKIYSRLLPLLNLTKGDVASLGSTGKKLPGGSSGDVDLAISVPALMKNNGLFKKEEIYPFLINAAESLGVEYNYIKGLGIVSIAWPIENIDGKQGEKIVQLDLMPSDNLRMTSWGMNSPWEKEEPYKGAVRNELLYWIANELDYKALRKEGELDTEFERNIFEPMNGLIRLKQSYYSPKTGKRMKNKQTIFRQLYNSNPDEITKLLFGPNVNADDLVTTKATWRAFMSPDFPYPEKREEIVRKTIDGLKAKGFAYPSYFDEFLKGNIIVEAKTTSFDTARKSMTKIHQMNAEEFVNFIKLLKNKIKEDGTLDLSTLNVTEKADGQGFRLIVHKDQIGAESSYSGVRFDPEDFAIESFKETLRYCQYKLGTKLLRIAKKHDKWFKLVGELFYINDPNVIDEDNSVTFVATKYNSSKLGKIASFIIFDCQEIKNNQLIDLDESEKKKIISEISKLSNDSFKIFTTDNFKWDKEITVEIKYNTPEIKAIFSNPESLLGKDPKTRNKRIAFQKLLADAFSESIARNGSVLGVPGTEVEGIVFEIDGQKYGATNFGWATHKKNIYALNDKMETVIGDFLSSIFGYKLRRKVLECIDNSQNLTQYSSEYKRKLPRFQKEIAEIYHQYLTSTANMPRNVWKQQLFFVRQRAEAIAKLTPNIMSLKEMLS